MDLKAKNALDFFSHTMHHESGKRRFFSYNSNELASHLITPCENLQFY